MATADGQTIKATRHDMEAGRSMNFVARKQQRASFNTNEGESVQYEKGPVRRAFLFAVMAVSAATWLKLTSPAASQSQTREYSGCSVAGSNDAF